MRTFYTKQEFEEIYPRLIQGVDDIFKEVRIPQEKYKFLFDAILLVNNIDPRSIRSLTGRRKGTLLFIDMVGSAGIFSTISTSQVNATKGMWNVIQTYQRILGIPQTSNKKRKSSLQTI